MKTLIPGLKAWPYHHEVEHLMGEALRADGHEVVFLGCSREGMSACECVDRAVHEHHGGHASFCAGCHAQQGGVHARAGFREIPMPHDVVVEAAIRTRLSGLEPGQILELPILGRTMREIVSPSLMRWARSGRPVELQAPVPVLRGHAAQALRLEALLPDLLNREAVELVLLLNGLFLSERVIAETAKAMNLRVVNYERGHARNTFYFSAGLPACFLEIDRLSLAEPWPQDKPDELLELTLAGRADNRDAATRFGTGAGTGGVSESRTARPQVAVFTNVCWDSAVSARGSGFGTYLDWLDAVLELARHRTDADFILRVHPGEARLQFDPTLDRTEAWLKERDLPANLEVIGAESMASSYDLMRRVDVGIVFVTSVGLEMACLGKPVLVCGDVHYAGKGFTRDVQDSADLAVQLEEALVKREDSATLAGQAKRYASRLFLDAPTPFPWVDEVEYGRPQRLVPLLDPDSLCRDPLLTRLVDYLVGRVDRPHSLRELLTIPQLCPLPFHYGSRVARADLRLGILITAHERPETLRRALHGWANQRHPSELLDVLVVDDGSQPPLESALLVVIKEIEQAGFELKVNLLRLDRNGGPARARNAGLEWFLGRESLVDRVLITGDDMLPEPGLLQRLVVEHRAWDDERVAILGKVSWEQSRGQSRVMRLVERNGMQFGFSQLPARAWLPAQYFYTSSVSLNPRFIARTGLRFAEDFPHAAWEDVEFGVRAMEQGLVLVYDAAIQLRHDHPTEYAGFSRRQRKAGACARVFHTRRPRDHEAICGPKPADPPDRQVMHALERALGELTKLDLNHLRGLPGTDADLAAQLDREQDRILETLFRLHADAGWFSHPPLPTGAGVPDLLSVLIPVHNQAELTRSCLEALHRHTSGRFEVLIVDNGSTDHTKDVLALWSQVRVLHQERNLGFARATNLAAAAATGSLLVLLNNDTEVRPGWDLPLREELARAECGAVGLKLLYPDNSVQHAGLVFGTDGLPWQIYRGFPAHAREVNQRRLFNAVTGACMGIRRGLLREIGGLDENFINCYEDIDLCLRLRERGLEVVYRPDGEVVHHEGRSAGRNDRVTHSWLVLQEKWSGRMPNDEMEILAADGWQVVREAGIIRLRKSAEAARQSARFLRNEADRMMEQGEVQQARSLLTAPLERSERVDRPDELRRALLELELKVGNLGEAQRWAECCRPRPDQRLRLHQLRLNIRKQMADLGIRVEL